MGSLLLLYPLMQCEFGGCVNVSCEGGYGWTAVRIILFTSDLGNSSLVMQRLYRSELWPLQSSIRGKLYLLSVASEHQGIYIVIGGCSVDSVMFIQHTAVQTGTCAILDRHSTVTQRILDTETQFLDSAVPDQSFTILVPYWLYILNAVQSWLGTYSPYNYT